MGNSSIFFIASILIGLNSFAGPVFSIPCRDDSGVMAGGKGSFCAAIAPKCSSLKNSYEAKVKDLLAWKIWGYYQGKDIDIEHSTPDSLTGPQMPYPICSVVGHQLKYSGAMTDFEISNQTVEKKLSCGKRPQAIGHGASLLAGIASAAGLGSASGTLELKFTQDSGALWNSYLMGAYPWIIRKNAYDVLHELKPDLSNIGDVIKSEAMKKTFANLSQSMTDYYLELSDAAKEVCDSGKTDVEIKCQTGGFTVADPAARICMLVRSQAASNQGALPNVLVSEIMARVHEQYDSMFGALLTHQSVEFNGFFSSCQDEGSSGLYGLDVRKPYSCAASCLFGGADFYTFNDNTVEESNGSGRSARRCTVRAAVNLVNGGLVSSTGPAPVNAKRSANQGFAGFVEYLIRSKVCGQSKLNDDNVCDQVQIPDKPANIK